jgi:hypothetical protein
MPQEPEQVLVQDRTSPYDIQSLPVDKDFTEVKTRTHAPVKHQE